MFGASSSYYRAKLTLAIENKGFFNFGKNTNFWRAVVSISIVDFEAGKISIIQFVLFLMFVANFFNIGVNYGLSKLFFVTATLQHCRRRKILGSSLMTRYPSLFFYLLFEIKPILVLDSFVN